MTGWVDRMKKNVKHQAVFHESEELPLDKNNQKNTQNLGKLDLMTSHMTRKEDRAFFARENVNPLTNAFDKKSTVHAGLGGKPVKQSRITAIWNELMDTPRDRQTALYVHIPFVGPIVSIAVFISIR